MSDLESLILRARDGDGDAYAAVVRRFQDMAVGYALAVLRDAHLAEDAAQEAFLEAFRCLGSLHEPAAFPGWFRRVVFKHCDRIARRRRRTVPLDEAEGRSADTPAPPDALERRESVERLLDAVDDLPDRERAAVTLFHIGEYSHREVGAFLGVPVTTVKKRLHDGRAHLRRTLLAAVEEELRGRRPSRDERFAARVVDLLEAARRGDVARVHELLLRDARLASARDALGNTALVLASNAGRDEVVALLADAGVRPDVHDAAAIGRTERVAELVDEVAARLDAYSREGFTPLTLAAHHDHPSTAEWLLDRGADVNAVARHPMRVTPLHSALFGRSVRSARLLLARGADPSLARGGDGPRAGWTALHYAAGFGIGELVAEMLARGARADLRDAAGRTPVDLAVEAGHLALANRLRDREKGSPGVDKGRKI